MLVAYSIQVFYTNGDLTATIFPQKTTSGDKIECVASISKQTGLSGH